jgi:16S rRNA (guanine966-N2)-methyltransferase
MAGTGFSQQARVYHADVVRVLDRLTGPYQLVLMDPPYRLQNLGEVLDKIASMPGLVDNQGILVVGHSKHQELLSHYGPLELESHRRYGDNVVDFYIRR